MAKVVLLQYSSDGINYFVNSRAPGNWRLCSSRSPEVPAVVLELAASSQGSSARSWWWQESPDLAEIPASAAERAKLSMLQMALGPLLLNKIFPNSLNISWLIKMLDFWAKWYVLLLPNTHIGKVFIVPLLAKIQKIFLSGNIFKEMDFFGDFILFRKKKSRIARIERGLDTP